MIYVSCRLRAIQALQAAYEVGTGAVRIHRWKENEYTRRKICIPRPRICLQNVEKWPGRRDIGVTRLLCCRKSARTNFNANSNKLEEVVDIVDDIAEGGVDIAEDIAEGMVSRYSIVTSNNMKV